MPVLIAIALYVRMRIDETPVFVAEKARNAVPRAPIAELLRLQRRKIVLAGGSILGGMCFVYMSNTYLTRYAHSELGYTRSFIWAVGALGGLVSIAFVALSATLCDRVGRRRMMLLGWAGCVLWALAVIPLIDTGNRCSTRWPSSACARSAESVPGPPEHSFPSCSPPATATAERRSRSTSPASSAAPCRHWSPGPLQATYGSWAIGPMLAILALAGFVCTYLLPETKGTALHCSE